MHKLSLLQTTFLAAAPQKWTLFVLPGMRHLPPSSADVLAASAKPVTLGPSPEKSHSQTHEHLPSPGLHLLPAGGPRSGFTLPLLPPTCQFRQTVWPTQAWCPLRSLKPCLTIVTSRTPLNTLRKSPEHRSYPRSCTCACQLQQRSNRWQSGVLRKGCFLFFEYSCRGRTY